MSFIDIFKSEQFKGEIENLKAQNSKYKKQVENVDRYFKEIMKLIQFNTKVSLDAFLFSKEDTKTYLDYKNKIQEDINSLFRRENDKKIVIIIDDFDRIDESKQDVILNFIKEVIDFKCCTTIFAVDFNNLLHNKKIDFGYMEKFIDIKFDLCQLDFKDILEYHMEEIFEDITFENEKSKEILNEIKSNVFSYYKNIENRMVTWETNREESSKKQGEDEKQRYDNETLEIVSYSRNKLSNNNNSRRGIHFLNSIKNTILLVDELYPNYNYGIELLNSINCAEIIYFFTYIKIFNPNIYLGIVNESGVEEYRSYLKAEINKKIKDENQ